MPRLCNPFIVILNVGASHIAYVLKVDARTNTKHGIIAARGERVRPEAFTRSVTLQLHYGSRLSFSCRITVHLGSEPSFKVDRTLFSYTRNHRRAKTAQRRSFRIPDEKKNTQTSIIVRRNLCQCTLIYSAMRRVQPEDRTVENSECSVYMIDDDRKPRECNCCMW